jgi:hypothetical protein
MNAETMNYQDWLQTVPSSLTGDSVWNMEAYRLALFAADVAWLDVTKLLQDKRTLGLSSQLYDAVGSIGANLSEGYHAGPDVTAPGSTSMRWVQPAKAARGTSMGVMCWVRSPTIA